MLKTTGPEPASVIAASSATRSATRVAAPLAAAMPPALNALIGTATAAAPADARSRSRRDIPDMTVSLPFQGRDGPVGATFVSRRPADWETRF